MRRAYALRIACSLVVLGSTAEARTAYISRPNPLSEEHLSIVRTADFRLDDDTPAPLFTHADAVFDTGAVVVTQQVSATVRIRHKAVYTLWIKCGRRLGPSASLKAVLKRNNTDLLKAVINDGPGTPDRGGKAAYEAYIERAVQNEPLGGAVTDIRLALQEDDLNITETPGLDDTVEDDIAGLLREAAAPDGGNWITPDRVDPATPLRSAWWRLGPATLDEGRYTLVLAPSGEHPAITVPLVDAAFLTSYDKLAYPYSPDINAPRASYIRFRINSLPEYGLTVRANINTHAYPYWNTPWVYLNPDGIPDERDAVPHRETGFTAWYCLQDIERGPRVTSRGQMQLRLRISPDPGTETGMRGITQFAMFPYADSVVREFAWTDPDALGINMLMDFEAGLHHLKTYRDCAREHYDRALTNAFGRLTPLTRDGMWVGGSGGGCTPNTQDYLCKTLRLLGYNIANVTQDPIPNRNRYGWGSFSGHARMKWFAPLPGEPEPVTEYEKVYRPIFERRPDFYAECPVWQMVDEPGEAYRSTMTAPLWRYEEDAEGGPRWVDYPGQSELYTRSLAYSNCVLEGTIAKLGQVVRIIAAANSNSTPSRYVYWRLGKVLPDTAPENFMAGNEGFERDETMARIDPKAALGKTPVPFKIVVEDGYAGFFLNDVMLHQFSDVPLPGAFGFAEGPKAIGELRIRPIGPDEHIAPEDDVGAPNLTTTDDESGMGNAAVSRLLTTLEDGGETNRPATPLKEFVEEDWVVAGGYPNVHAGYRAWLRDRGITPDLFGKESWEQVSPLTLENLVRSPADARSFYWSRQFSAWLTPKIFSLAAEALRRAAPNKQMWSYVGLSGGYPNVYGCTIVDMFQLASYTNGLMPGISDWHWPNADSEQVNAYSAAIFNAGARRPGKDPASISMMHIVHPSPLRAHTSLAEGVKYLSYYTFGPFCLGVGHDPWSEIPVCYEACSLLNNRVAQVDDLVARGFPRPSRVAMLWSQATDHWDQAASFKDKRSAFLALSHAYYQPDLVTEQQVADGALQKVDALYVLEPHVAGPAREAIAAWVSNGGLLWYCADALTRNEYDEPVDLPAELCGLRRRFEDNDMPDRTVQPVEGDTAFRSHPVDTKGMPVSLETGGHRVRARYEDGSPAWVEAAVGRGRIVYVAHRCGLTYRAQQIRYRWQRVWTDCGRSLLTAPLLEKGVSRDLVLSEPAVLARPLESDGGTVVVLYNMQPTPRRDLEIRLREGSAPFSVQRFDGLQLVSQPATFEDGFVRIVLDELEKGQILVVRRRPPPEDNRWEGIYARALELLESDDPMDLAAGAWYTGLCPDLDADKPLSDLLDHPRWEVRRSAAEAIGNLHRRADADALVKAIERETDAHALGDALYALGILDPARAAGPALEHTTHAKPFVRIRAVETLRHGLLERNDKTLRRQARQAADVAIEDPDLRIRREGIRLLAQLDPAQLLERTLLAFSETTPDTAAQPDWAGALAGCDPAFDAYLAQDAPGGTALLLSVATHRRDARLASLLVARVHEAEKATATAWVSALTRQADPSLARELVKRQEELPALADALPYVLVHAFPEARPGNRLEDWTEWLDQKGNHTP